MILEKLQKQVIEAMKARDKNRANVLRNLVSEIKNAKIDNPDLNDEDAIVVIKREAKKRKDAIEIYKKAGSDKAKEEEAELEILQEFLPAEMGDDELSKIVEDVISELGATDVSAVGKVMGGVMGKVGGKASGDRVSALVRDKLANTS